jgi:hypothetical protein
MHGRLRDCSIKTQSDILLIFKNKSTYSNCSQYEHALKLITASVLSCAIKFSEKSFLNASKFFHKKSRTTAASKLQV